MSKHIFRVEKNRNYTIMSNFHFKDERLSWKAKGIHSYVLSLPDDWEIRLSHLKSVSTDGEKSTRSGLKELYDLRYWQKYPVYIDGVVAHWETKISEEPFLKEEIIKSIVIDSDDNIQVNFLVESELSKSHKKTKKDGKKDFSNSRKPADKKLSTGSRSKSDYLLSQKGQVVDNTNVHLLSQKVEVDKLHVDKGRLLNTNITNNTNFNNHSVNLKDIEIDKTNENIKDRLMDYKEKIINASKINDYKNIEDRSLLIIGVEEILKEAPSMETVKHLMKLEPPICDMALFNYKKAIRENPDINNKLKYFTRVLYNSINDYLAEVYF